MSRRQLQQYSLADSFVRRKAKGTRWLEEIDKAFAGALGSAGSAFDGAGQLVQAAHTERVRAVVDQVLWASARLHGDTAAGQ